MGLSSPARKGPGSDKASENLDLTDSEREILDKQISAPSVNVSYSTLYRYASPLDIAGLVLGTLFAAAAGAIMPFLTVSDFLGSIDQTGINLLLGPFR